MNNETIEVKIPKEVKFEPRIVGPFTLRQTICVTGLAGCCIPVYVFTNKLIGMDLSLLLCMIVSVPWAAFGWFTMYGQPFEKFIKTIFISTFLSPSKRLYKTENYFESIAEQIKKEEYENMTIKEKKQDKKNKKVKKSRKSIK